MEGSERERVQTLQTAAAGTDPGGRNFRSGHHSAWRGAVKTKQPAGSTRQAGSYTGEDISQTRHNTPPDVISQSALSRIHQ